MPAELLMEGKMTKAADVYSFAMLMHELLTGQQLFEGMRQSQVCTCVCKLPRCRPQTALPALIGQANARHASHAGLSEECQTWNSIRCAWSAACVSCRRR